MLGVVVVPASDSGSHKVLHTIQLSFSKLNCLMFSVRKLKTHVHANCALFALINRANNTNTFFLSQIPLATHFQGVSPLNFFQILDLSPMKTLLTLSIIFIMK